MMDERIAKGVIGLLQNSETQGCSSGCYTYRNSFRELRFCESLFLYAVKNGHDDIVKKLLDHGVTATLKGTTCPLDSREMSVLHIAVVGKHVKVAKLLLENGADANELFNHGRWDECLLSVAAENGSKEMLELLLDFGANPNRELVDNWDPVCSAASDGNAEIVKILLDRGANCDSEKVMCLGAQTGSKEIVRLMHERGVDLNDTMIGADDDPALFRACQRSTKEVVEVLLNFGAVIDGKNNFNKTCLHAALDTGTIDVVQLLVDRGANIYLTDTNGGTSLHYAASRSYDDDPSFLELMLNLGLDINTVDSNGSTPLHHSAESNKESILKLLLNRGVDINQKNNAGNTAISEIAKENKQLQSAKILIKHIAQMKGDNLKVSKKSLKAIRKNGTLNGFSIQYDREIESLKSKTFDDSLLTVYDVLNATNESQYVAFARNKNIVEVLTSKDFKSNYPIFGVSITERLSKAMLKNQSLDQVKVFFHKLAVRRDDKLPKLPLNCLVEIFGYLSNDDVTNLSSFL